MDDQVVEELRGGVNKVVRRGGTVVRPMGRHSCAVHQVLVHLEDVGFDGAPRLLTVDDNAQTETLTYLEGDVADYPLPTAFTSDAAMRSAAQLLRRLHDAMDTFTVPDDLEGCCRPSSQPRSSCTETSLRTTAWFAMVW